VRVPEFDTRTLARFLQLRWMIEDSRATNGVIDALAHSARRIFTLGWGVDTVVANATNRSVWKKPGAQALSGTRPLAPGACSTWTDKRSFAWRVGARQTRRFRGPAYSVRQTSCPVSAGGKPCRLFLQEPALDNHRRHFLRGGNDDPAWALSRLLKLVQKFDRATSRLTPTHEQTDVV